MILEIVPCQVSAWSVVWNAGIGRTVETTTTGGQDKRAGTLAGYVLVVVRYFQCRERHYSAASIHNTLIYVRFYGAAPVSPEFPA